MFFYKIMWENGTWKYKIKVKNYVKAITELEG